MVRRDAKDRVESVLTDEEIMNYRIRKTSMEIEMETRKENKSKHYEMDPYFDSIKNWHPI